ncbi:hypothetical protein EST38_g7562 [Candolleomyces aberdarensis]|uniref:DUF7918 domain-containing protein n=1 Tax=Candolleomyces aberdarensis TaxID=2316362 RepID=A0A4Q2DEW6_9AGAR|nr:hypothetical protein EST38_g7562 [Candolleomyces aberdarensis]
MPELLGFNFWIEMDGDRREEYGVKYSTGLEIQEVVCTVPCEAGKEFQILYDVPSNCQRNYDLVFQIDGKYVDVWDTFIPRIGEGKGTRRHYPKHIEGQSIGQDLKMIRPFQFTRLRSTDDEKYLLRDITQLGDITIEIFTLKRLVYLPEDAACEPKQRQHGTGIVHETHKKLLKSFVKFGRPQPRKQPLKPAESSLLPRPSSARLQRGSNGDGEDSASSEVENDDMADDNWNVYSYRRVGAKLVGKIVFKYRDMDVLIAQGLAPPHVPEQVVLSEPTPTVRPVSAPAYMVVMNPDPNVHQPAGLSQRLQNSVSSERRGAVCAVDVEDSDDSEAELKMLEDRLVQLKEMCDLQARIAVIKAKKRARKAEKAGTPAKRLKVQHDAEPEPVERED